jgi:uncharacterized protein involved in exopolysaccharide biosynthesis
MVDSWVRLARRRWVAGVLLFVVVAVAGSAFVLLSRSVYRAESRLRLGEPPPMSGVSPTASVLGLMRLGGDPFANDLELLASRTLAEDVVDDVALHVRLSAPRGWHRDSLMASLAAGRQTERAVFDVAWADDAVVITAPDRARVTGRAGDVLEFGDVSAVFRPWRPGMPRRVRLVTVPHAQAARELGSAMKVERTRRDANVVRVSFQSTDPRVTHDVVASAVIRFVALRTRLLQRESGETVDSLRGVALRTQQELAAAEAALQELQRRTGLIAPETQAELAVERYADLQVALQRARLEASALNQALERSAASADAAGSWAALLAYPRFLENEMIGSLLTQLTELEQERRELARRRTAENEELRVIHDRIAHLDQSLRTVAADFATTLHGEVMAAERQTVELQGQLAGAPANMIEFGRRQRELRILSEITVLTEQRLRQEELRQALTFANVQVIDPPALRDRPVWPRRKRGPAVAVLLAGATALLGMVVLDRADRAVRTAQQARAALGVPVLAVISSNGAAPGLTATDATAIWRRAVVEPDGVARIGVVDLAGGRAAALVARSVDNGRAGCPRELRVLPAPDSYGAAGAVAAAGLPILIAVEAGSTTETALASAVALLGEAGAELVGAVLVCNRSADAVEVWT